MPNAVWAYSGAAGACSTRTRLQSQPSSSATTIGMDVHTPWPISECLSRIVTLSSGAMRMNAFGDTGGFVAGAGSAANARRAATGTMNATTRPAAADFTNARRPSPAVSGAAVVVSADANGTGSCMPSRHMAALLRREFGGAMHGAADALVGAAATEVARHRGIDVGVARR